MNNLSWFLYFAEIAPRIGLLAMLSVPTAALIVAFAPPKGVKPFSRDHEHPFMGWHYGKKWVIFAITVTLLAFLVPSKATIYLIAGSEAGEAVVTSQEGKEIMADIKDIIRHQLDSLKGN